MLVAPPRADGPRQHPHPVAEDELAALPAGDEQADHSRSRKNEKRAAWPRLSLPASRRPERQAPPDQGGAEGPVPVVADRDMTGSVMGDRAERVEAGRHRRHRDGRADPEVPACRHEAPAGPGPGGEDRRDEQQPRGGHQQSDREVNEDRVPVR